MSYNFLPDFGATLDGVADDGPALSAALLASKANGLPVVLPRGVCRLATPLPDINFQTRVTGMGKSATHILREYTEPSIARGVFALGEGANGTIIEDLGVRAGSVGGGGSAISLIASVTGAPDFVTLRNLYLTSIPNNKWGAYTLYVDGSPRSGAPIGVRDLVIEGCSIFGAPNGAVLLRSTVAAKASGSDTFQAGGTSGRVVVTGTPTVKSFYPHWNGSIVYGFSFDQCEGGTFAVYVAGQITNASSAANIRGVGRVTDGVQSFWTTSSWVA